ncbi:MAG: formylglycine-generating enzyme family protein [Gemmataceae bacterium]
MGASETLLQALLQDYNDPLLWLALADALEEEGRARQAELLRLSRQLESLPPRPEAQGSCLARIEQLLLAGVEPVRPHWNHPEGLTFVFLTPGLFWMGSPAEEDNRHDDEFRHLVELTRPFWISAHLVTQRQFRQVMQYNPSSFRPLGEMAGEVEGLLTDEFPVDSVSWYEALEFCTRLTRREPGALYRLPTEAEWEYACRAGTATEFAHGSSLSSYRANFDGSSPYGTDLLDLPTGPTLGRPCPVGSYPPNAWGLYDMHGQLDEWCLDWYEEDYYRYSPRCDPRGPAENDMKVLRGGTWSNAGRFCRSAFRWRAAPDYRQQEKGFRVVREFLPA